MTPSDFITFHLGCRQPKAYKPGTAGPAREAQLADKQPDPKKYRLKVRFDPATPPRVMAQEIELQLHIHDHGTPVWIAGTDATAVQRMAMWLGIDQIREWQPEQGDE